ncbi:MAG TPA: site-specific integrase [Rubrivivax sp.]|jgi:site-specific recombinase XerD|nr:site-specific integrase [Rubrivivax sp.]
MSPTRRPDQDPINELQANPLASHADAFERHLHDWRYASSTRSRYLSCLGDFACWMDDQQLAAEQLDEAVTARFLSEHLSRCRSLRPPWPLQAALKLLLTLLRAKGVIAERMPAATPVEEELRRFDAYMDHVRGLAAKTRSQHCRTVSRFLREQFGAQPIVIATIAPEALRRFVACQSERYRSPGDAASMIAALRGYFRFRSTCGDEVHALIGVLAYPMRWALSSLPQTLSSTEIKRLDAVLGGGAGLSPHRTEAMVRCALDLGLRRGEIAGLSLDDIDWRAGTLRLRHTKGQREDCLPLPQATGRAIADYLQLERPQTLSRAIFVRHATPIGQPIGPDTVAKAIRQAYARAGLPYTRTHLLRHTLASRLLAGGSSLKEVADVLRHRSLETTQIYAKLDGRNLSTIALPWPGRDA